MRPQPVTHSGQPVRFGARLRAERRRQGFTIDQVAEASGLTKGFLSRVERDETQLSVSSLVALCEVLSLQVGTLFEQPPHEVVTREDAPQVAMGGEQVTEYLLTPRAQAGVQVMRSVIEPGGNGGDELYTINCDVEVLHVVKGSIELETLGGRVTLRRGDTMTLAGREPHTWRNTTRSVTEVLWVITPAAWTG